jgi:hypothetical protein
LMVLPSNSMVRIFWPKRITFQATKMVVMCKLYNSQSLHQLWKCNFLCRYHLQNVAASKTFRLQSRQ